MPDGDVVLCEAFFSKEESEMFFERLQDEAKWKQERIKLYGKPIDIPRLTAWYGEPGKVYTYSGVRMEPEPWTPSLLAMKDKIEPVSGVLFNSALLNLYRRGQDSVSWHSDDEPELGPAPVIGSVSLGATRTFQFRHKVEKGLRLTVELTHGSYLLMKGATQECWQHQVPKTKREVGRRINLTFRVIQ
jgi:alkylated DNA repair dioxygenase AlkB